MDRSGYFILQVCRELAFLNKGLRLIIQDERVGEDETKEDNFFFGTFMYLSLFDVRADSENKALDPMNAAQVDNPLRDVLNVILSLENTK